MSREKNRRVYKVVLTGGELIFRQEFLDFYLYSVGPCGGKTSGKSRLAVFFESYGFQVIQLSIYTIILYLY